MSILQVENLTIFVKQNQKLTPMVKNINFSIEEGECVGLVGESGSGKSLTAQTIACLDNYPFEGSIKLQGECFKLKSEKEKRRIRSKQIGMIFQDPQVCLNPTIRVGKQIQEVNSFSLTKKDVFTLLEQVGLSDSERCFMSYPHELSGGMCQRVMIAIALARRPKLLIADEPTAALDLTYQAQILNLMKDIQISSSHMSTLLITHDFGVVERMCKRVLVMYKGEIIENGWVEQIMHAPQHSYTKALLAARPKLRRKT